MNTTDMLITCFYDDNAIDYINNETGLAFTLVDRKELRSHIVFNSFSHVSRCLSAPAIGKVIAAFQDAPFSSPEFAVLIISDDNNTFNGVVLRQEQGLLVL